MYTDISTIDQEKFVKKIRIEMKYRGMTMTELALAISIKKQRMFGLLNVHFPFTREEELNVKKLFGID
jgi:hypothetical protein